MDELRVLLQENLNTEFLSAVLSNPRIKDGTEKVKVRPLLKKGTLFFQVETFRNRQAFHENLTAPQACEALARQMENMKQMQLETQKNHYTVLVSKKGKVTVKKKAQTGKIRPAELSHDRKKHYILEEGTAVPFLVDLGVMTKEGKIVHARYDKFRQINRFLEFIEDILPRLERGRELTILDFGCGKSYLTFAMYYYLHELKGYDIRIIGLDLKREVIIHCNELAEKYGYQKLKFLVGDIADYTGVDRVDMVVTLHACDTATDYALYKAVRWGADVILSVPCSQHELNKQLSGDRLRPVTDYGILKERFAAMATDAIRGGLLEGVGYETQILEFIDMEHTPKNLLIRAVYTGKKKDNEKELRACLDAFHLHPTLESLLFQGGAEK